MLRNHIGRDSLVALLTLLLSACLSSPEPADAPEPPPAQDPITAPVAQVSQALGSFTTLWSGVSDETPLFVNTNWTAFRYSTNGCDQVDMIKTPTGEAAVVTLLSTCDTLTAAGGDTTLFVGSSTQNIYGTMPVFVGGTPSMPQYEYHWTQVASTIGSNISKIVADSQNVYWQDSTGIYRAPRPFATPNQIVKIGLSNRTLLAVDGSVLWVQRNDGGGQWSLRTIGINTGLPELIKATNTMPFAPGFFVEDSYAWWVENGAADGYNRLRRLTKADGTISTMKISMGLMYSLPMRKGTVLYYIDKSISSGTVTMRSHNITTGVQTSATVGVLDVLHMALGSSVYFTARTSASPALYDLESGTL